MGSHRAERTLTGPTGQAGLSDANDRPARLLTLPEVASALRVSPKTIRRLVAGRGLPHYRLGRVLRFDPADVSRWLTARKER